MGNNFLNSGKWVATMWIFQEWGEMCFKRYSIANHRNVTIHLFCSSTLHGWYKNNPPFIQVVWELSLGSFQHFKTPPVSGIFQTLWVLIFFPQEQTPFLKSFHYILEVSNSLKSSPAFQICSNPASAASSACPTGLTEFPLQNQQFTLIFFLPNLKVLCFLLTMSKLFHWIGGHWHDGLFIASEKIFLLSSHLFRLLHILLNLHFVFDKSRNTSEIVLLGTGMPIAYILLFIIFLPLYFYLSTEFLEWRKRMLKGAD